MHIYSQISVLEVYKRWMVCHIHL